MYIYYGLLGLNMADKTEPIARLTIEPCGELGLYIRIDGKLMDIIHYSDIERMPNISRETKDAIDRIYQDCRAKWSDQ